VEINSWRISTLFKRKETRPKVRIPFLGNRKYLSTKRRRLHIYGERVTWISHFLIFFLCVFLFLFLFSFPSLLEIWGLFSLWAILLVLSIVYSFSLSLFFNTLKCQLDSESPTLDSELTRGPYTLYLTWAVVNFNLS
jgi:Na+/proline symporter